VSKIVVEQLQSFLVAQGVGQLPGATPSVTLPSIWTMPRENAAMPRMKDGAFLEKQTITLHDTNLSGPPGAEAWIEDTFVDVIVRSKNDGEGKLLHRAIAGLLHPIGKLSGRADWTMNELRVLYSQIWRREQALPSVQGGLTYDRVASYRIGVARSQLA
jgi:hypothetical protein